MRRFVQHCPTSSECTIFHSAHRQDLINGLCSAMPKCLVQTSRRRSKYSLHEAGDKSICHTNSIDVHS